MFATRRAVATAGRSIRPSSHTSFAPLISSRCQSTEEASAPAPRADSPAKWTPAVKSTSSPKTATFNGVRDKRPPTYEPDVKTAYRSPQPAAFSQNGSSSNNDGALLSAAEPTQRADAVRLDVDWTESYHGVSTSRLTEEQFKALSQPLDLNDIEVKPDGVIYLPEIKYRRKLNEVFGPMGWGMVPRGEVVVGDNIVTREYALIIDGRFASQSQGENNYFGNDQLPSAVEGCKSNALMRCCKDLGIAAELWDPQFVRWYRTTHMASFWVEHQTTKKKKTMWFKKGETEVAYPWKLSGAGPKSSTSNGGATGSS